MTTTTQEKPPLGIMPATLFYADRILSLSMAINRYRSAGLAPLPEWTNELDALALMAEQLKTIRIQTDRPSREEVTDLIAEISRKNRAYHGGTHTDLINAVQMLARLMQPPTPSINDFLCGVTHAD